MRVIAGALGGRMFDAPPGHRTHPMSDKVRGAIFNTLGDIASLAVFDAYAGSGALGIEAISRGAATVTALDIDKAAYLTIRENVAQLGIDQQMTVIRANVTGWSENNNNVLFDIVLADPPYDTVNERALVIVASHTKPGGLFVCSLPPTIELSDLPGFKFLTTKSYGDATVTYFRKK